MSARATTASRFGPDRLLDVAVPAALLLLWFIVGQWKWVDPFLVPHPVDVFRRMMQIVADGQLPWAIFGTLYRALAAFALAVAICVPLGLAIARIAALRWFFDPLISIGFPMPKVAFIPIFILWLGVFDLSKIVVAAFACSFTLLATTVSAASHVERVFVWSALSLGASKASMLWQIVLPAALPRILTGMQIALPIALITTIAAEMIMGGTGLGGTMMRAGRFADTPGVYAGIIASGAVGFALVKCLETLRRYLLSWHQEQRETR